MRLLFAPLLVRLLAISTRDARFLLYTFWKKSSRMVVQVVSLVLVSLFWFSAGSAANPWTVAAPSAAPAAPAVANLSSTVFNVREFGAHGNGATDDTAAIQAAVSALYATSFGGVLYFPAGSYRVTSTIQFPSPSPVTIQGDGWQSVILWQVVGHLMAWPSNLTAAPITNLLLRDLEVQVAANWSTTPVTTPYFAFSMPCGLTQSLVHHVKVTNSYSGYGVSGIDMGYITDTVEWTHNLLWMLTGTGIRVGKGSEVRIIGGRVISTGPFTSPAGAIGVHVTGNNGGVHLVNTDIIAWHRGVVLDSSNGEGSNREIFISQATIDSNHRGLVVNDNSYIDITGCWAASSVLDNIWTNETSNPQLVITGGTIFNAGAYGGNCSDTECNGIRMNGGSLTLSALVVRNNQGRGVWFPTYNVNNIMINGVKFFGNTMAAIEIDFPFYGACFISSSLGYQNGANVIPGAAGCTLSNNQFS